MTTETQKEIIEFLESIQDTNEKAKELAENIFKEQVIDLWDFDLTQSYSKDEYRQIVKKGIKVVFSRTFDYNSGQIHFIEKHWDKMDQIIKILQDYVKELEKEEVNDND